MSKKDGEESKHRETEGDAPSGQLLRLADFDRAQPARILMELRNYWQSLRQGRAIPSRADIDPRGIHRLLDHAFILERIAPGAARFRLAGRHLIDLMGMEVRGMPLCSLMNPSSRGRLSDVLESVFKAPQIAELRLEAKADYARPALIGRMLLLPLKSDLGDVTRALGCLVSEGEAGVAPRRFDMIEERITPVIEGGIILNPSPSAQGFAERSEGFRSKVAKPRHPIQPKQPQAPKLPETPEERRARFQVVSNNSAP